MAAQRTIGIDVGGTKILAGVVERDGTVLRTERRETPVESTQAFLEGLAEVVDALRDDSVAAVGIGIPSTIDQRSGSSVFSVHVPIEGLPLRERGEGYLGLPVAIDNDANAAAVAEWTIGAGRGTQHMIMLTLGTGIGGGLILGGRLYRERAAPLPSWATWCSSSTGPSAAVSARGGATSSTSRPGAPRTSSPTSCSGRSRTPGSSSRQHGTATSGQSVR